jgi:hypothetical protein
MLLDELGLLGDHMGCLLDGGVVDLWWDAHHDSFSKVYVSDALADLVELCGLILIGCELHTTHKLLLGYLVDLLGG